MKGDYDAAIKRLEAAVNKFLTEWVLWYELSDAYKAKGDHDAVIKTLETAVDKFPTKWRLRDGLSDAYKGRAIMMQQLRRWRPRSTSFLRNGGYGID